LSRTALVFGCAFALLIQGALDSRIDGDTTRDLLRARDCVEGYGSCAALQIDAHVIGHLVHGPLWMRFVIAGTALGLKPLGLAKVMVALFAVAAVLMDRWVAGSFSPLLAPATAGLFITHAAESVRAVLWNPTLGFVLVMGFYFCLSRMIAGNGRKWMVLAAVALYGSIECHVSCFVLLPFFYGLVLISLGAGDAAAAAGAVGVPALLFSREALAINLSPDEGLLYPLAGCFVLVHLVAPALRSRWNRLSILHRQTIVVVAAAFAYLAVMQLFQLRGGPGLSGLSASTSGYYAVSVAPAIAALPAALFACVLDLVRKRQVARPIRNIALARVARAASPFVVAAIALSVDQAASLRPGAILAAFAGILKNQPRGFSDPNCGACLRETAVLAQGLQAGGYSYDEIRRSLRGPRTNNFESDLLDALAVYAPRPPAPVVAVSTSELRVVRVRRDRVPAPLPASWRTIGLPGGRLALVSTIPGWVQTDWAEVFVNGSTTPLRPRTGGWTDPGSTPATFLDRIFWGPRMYTVEQLGQIAKLTDPLEKVEIELPIGVGDDAAAHTLDILGDEQPGWSAWKVERVDGVAHEIAEGGRSLLLLGSGSRTGTIRLVSSGSNWHDDSIDLFESTPAEAVIRPLLRGS
jgi:hypothetical protein